MEGLKTANEVVYDPFSEGFYLDPYPTYQRLRDEAPVYYSPMWNFYALSRYDDVRAAASDAATFVNHEGIDVGEPVITIPGFITDVDNPRHDQLRQVVQRAFLPRSIAKLEEQVRRVVREISAPWLGRGSADFTQEFAWQLPLGVFFDYLGLPTEGDDRAVLVQWLHEIKDRKPGDPSLTPTARAALWGSQEYLAKMLTDRRTNPRKDLLTTIVTAEIDGKPFAEKDIDPTAEIVGLAFSLYLAGIETTAALLTSFVKLLAEHPEQRVILRSDPSKLKTAIEEVARFDGPLQASSRTTTHDVTVRGTIIPGGSRVVLLWASANRDEDAFVEADKFDVLRPIGNHLGFGHGLHGCLGAHLARLETRVAMEELLPALGDYHISGPPALYPSTANSRGYGTLPITFTPR